MAAGSGEAMVARKPITYGGKRYKAGQRVPWAKMDGRTRQLLVEQRRVLPAPPPAKAPPKATKKGGGKG